LFTIHEDTTQVAVVAELLVPHDGGAMEFA